MDDDWLTLEEAAVRLGVSLNTIKDLLCPSRQALVGVQAPGGPEYHGRRPWLRVTRKSVEAHAARMATSVERRKEAQRQGYALKAARKVGMLPCPRCGILTDDGALCEFCWAELASARYKAITGRSLINGRTIGVELDTWRVGRLVLER